MEIVEVVPLSLDILMRIDPRDGQISPPVQGAWGKRLIFASTYAAAAIDKKTGQPIGALGLVEQWNGVADVWAVADKTIEKYPIAVSLAVRRFLDTSIRVFKLRWLNALVSSKDEKAMRYAQIFGFEKALFLPEYGPNREDFWLMIRRVR